MTPIPTTELYAQYLKDAPPSGYSTWLEERIASLEGELQETRAAAEVSANLANAEEERLQGELEATQADYAEADKDNYRLRGLLEAAQRESDTAFEKGIQSVLRIRCMEHLAVPQYNTSEASGGECAACTVEAERTRREEAERRLSEALEALEQDESMVEKSIAMLREHGYVFRRFPRDMRKEPPVNEEERWEALAFSLYTDIAEASSRARAVLAESTKEE